MATSAFDGITKNTPAKSGPNWPSGLGGDV